MTIHKVHRANAALLGTFILLHLLNHAFALLGPRMHIAIMELLRFVYRALPVEVLILTLFAVQIFVGLLLALKRGKPKGNWAWAQVISGCLLAFFLLQHLGAVLYMRLTSSLDTNFFWAASVASTDPIRWYFIPYYWLGMTSVFVHATAAMHFRQAGTVRLQTSIIVLGAILSLLVVASLTGQIHSFVLPNEYATSVRTD